MKIIDKYCCTKHMSLFRVVMFYIRCIINFRLIFELYAEMRSGVGLMYQDKHDTNIWIWQLQAADRNKLCAKAMTLHKKLLPTLPTPTQYYTYKYFQMFKTWWAVATLYPEFINNTKMEK